VLDKTFGPDVVFQKAPPPGQDVAAGLPPSEGMQFFGHIAIDGQTQVMTVTLKDVDDHALWSTKLEPKFA
jgi:alkaline phosphatase D